jgi:formate dehydrogenase subunit gamma
MKHGGSRTNAGAKLRSTQMKHDDPNLIVRYSPNERTNHWITAITFVLLALSGLALFHPSMFWLTALFGGGQWTRILHPFVGVVMFVSFLMLALRFWHHNYLDKSDIQWLRQIDDVLANQEDKLPEIGRYNAGQKLLFFVMVACLVLLLASGIVIWRRYFSFFFPIDVIRLAAVVHAIAAFVLLVGIVVHVYPALWVKGSIGAMVRGTVTLGWARKHHPRWFRESVK